MHLARLGHAVLGQDLSCVGLAKARQLAASRGVAIETHCCDLALFEPEPESFDLVVAIWKHLPPSLRAETHRRFGTGGPPTETLLTEPEVLRRELAGLELLVLEERERWIEEGQYHRGRSAVVQALGRKPG